MVITIYDREGNLKAEVEPSESSTQTKEIQGDNVLTLSFTHYEHIALDVDDYVDFEGERYWLTERAQPVQKSTKEWSYDLRLYGIESMVRNFLVIKRVDGEDDPVFTLTAPPREHVAMIVDCMNDGGGHVADWKVGEVAGTENIVIDYHGKYCDEALKEIAEKVGGEWWTEGRTVNVGRCELGEQIVLGYGKGLTGIDPGKADNVKFYTRLYPIGSSRNIDKERYGFSRLQLPGGKKYVEVNADKYGRVDHYEADAFGEIYPRRVGRVSSVRSEEKRGEDGKPFTIYYFRDDELTFDPNDYEIGGMVKRVSFQEGSELGGLGREDNGTYYFEVNYDSKTREFEIITIWPYDNDVQLPGGALVPRTGDKYILWNLRMPDEYYALAEEELLEAVNKYNEEHALDVTVFKAQTDHVWIEDNEVDLSMGQRVRLESEEFFPGSGYRDSRITKITRRVNLPSMMDIEIGDALSRTALQKMTDNVNDVRNYATPLVGLNAGLSELLEPCDAGNSPLSWGEAAQPDGSGGIRAKYLRSKVSFYSLGGLSALGAGGNVGGGGEAVSYTRLDDWAYYVEGNGDVLSAKLGYELKLALDNINITPPSFEGYATETWVNAQGFLKSVPGGYATEAWVTAQGYLKSVSWSTVTGKPAWIGPSKPTYEFREIGQKPDTLGGYGVIDAVLSGARWADGSLESELEKMPSFAGSVNVADGGEVGEWSGVISARHRNGRDDGTSYGFYIRYKFWGNGSLLFNTNKEGEWKRERTIIDNVNYRSHLDSAYMPLEPEEISCTGDILAYGDITAEGDLVVKGGASINGNVDSSSATCGTLTARKNIQSRGSVNARDGVTGDYIMIGGSNGVVLRYDEARKAVYAEMADGSAANLYATGGLSALGGGDIFAQMKELTGTIDIADIDMTMEERAYFAQFAKGASFYKVVNGDYCMGTMLMFSDTAGCAMTQILITNSELGEGGTSINTSAHWHDRTFVYIRNSNTAYSWLPWKKAFGHDTEARLAGAEAKIVDLQTEIGELKKLVESMQNR